MGKKVLPQPKADQSTQHSLFDSKDRIDADYREAERKRYDDAISKATTHAARNVPLSATRRSILLSFVYLHLDAPGFDPVAFIQTPLAILGGHSIEQMLELEHHYKAVQEWMKELRIQKRKGDIGYLIEAQKNL